MSVKNIVLLPVIILFLILSGCSSSSVPEKTPEKKTQENTEVRNIPEEQKQVNAADIINDFEKTLDYKTALEELEKAGTENLDDDSRLVYAVLLRNNGRLEDSEKELKTLISHNSGNADAWFNLALTYYAAGKTDKMNEALDETINTDPDYTEAWVMKGQLAAASSNTEKAELYFRKALAIDADNADALGGLGWAVAKNGDKKEALELFNKAVQLDPENVYFRVDRSRVNVVLRNYNDAEKDLDFAISREPDNPWHYLDRARIRLQYFKDYKGAREDLNMVEKLNPGNFFAIVYLAGLNDEERKFDEAEKYYKQVVEIHPDYIWAYMPLGKFAWMRKNYPEAAKWFLKASAEDPDNFSLLLMAGLSRLYEGRKDEAEKLFYDNLKNFKQGETAYEVIRFCAERNSDFFAVSALNKEQNENLREKLWFYMGAVYDFEGNSAGAQAAYERIADRKGEMEYDLAWAELHGMNSR